MRGIDHQQADMYSYLSPEVRVRADHPLRAIRVRAQLIQMLYSIRSERLLMEEVDYSMLLDRNRFCRS